MYRLRMTISLFHAHKRKKRPEFLGKLLSERCAEILVGITEGISFVRAKHPPQMIKSTKFDT